ncbi:protein kinase [Streptomyces sp. NPDC058955]|uniref:serine/threonine-protein kinase n=1 Tax=unclassified Streptomyces TaxID=2593676 RepID=UPI00364C551E
MADGTLTGRTLGNRYELIGPIGHGGMGEVYEGLDRVLDRRVAVKVIRSGLSTEDMRRRFLREAQVLARIAHPNTVTVYDAGEFAERPYLVMEYLQGISLQDLIGEGPLDEQVVRAVAAEMCEGLSAAHEAGVLHRDVKPSNVHLSRRGRVVLHDFGIASLLEADTGTLTAPGVIVGTPAYMSPEAVRGAATGTYSDLYGLGVCMYEMLSGELPFKSAGSAPVMLYRVANEGLPELTGVPADLAALVADLVHRDADLRPTAAETLDRLRPPADGEALVAAASQGKVRDRAVRRLSAPATDSVVRPRADDSLWTAPPVEGRESRAHQLRPAPETDPGDAVGAPGDLGLSGVARRHILRTMSPQVAASRLREAVNLVLRGELEEAVELLAAVSKVCEAALDPGHPTTIASAYWQAVCLTRLGADGEALVKFSEVGERLVEVERDRRGPGH